MLLNSMASVQIFKECPPVRASVPVATGINTVRLYATELSSIPELNSVDRCHPNIYSEIHVFIRIYNCLE